MSSNLKVNTILPSTGTAIGIGTASGNVDVLGHIVGQNTSNISGINSVTATTFYGSGANLTSLPAQATIANNADNRIITGGSGVNLNGESGLTYTGSRLTQSSGDTIIDQTNNGYGGLRIVDSSAGEYSVSYILGRNSGLSAHVFKYNGRTQNQSPWNNNSTGNEMGRWSAAGISFNGDTAAANAINDYEEGSWTPSNSTVGIYADNSRWGYYQKVGNWVTANFGVRFNNNGSGVNAYIDGLPFSSISNSGNYRFGGFITYKTVGDNYASSLLVENGSSRIWIYTSTGSNSQLTNFDNHYIRGTIIMKVA